MTRDVECSRGKVRQTPTAYDGQNRRHSSQPSRSSDTVTARVTLPVERLGRTVDIEQLGVQFMPLDPVA